MCRSRGVSASRGTARVVVVRVVVVLRTTLVRETRGSGRPDTSRVTSLGVAAARRTASCVVIASTVSGTVSTTVVAGTADRALLGAIAGPTGASTGRRVTVVPPGVCVTTVSTGSLLMVRVI